MEDIRTILLVDDKCGERELTEILGDEYHIIATADSTAALDQLKKLRTEISFAVINLSMGNIKGYKVLETLVGEAQYQDIPVIASGTGRDHKMEAAALELGAWDYISRPYNARIVKSRLRNVVRHCRRIQRANHTDGQHGETDFLDLCLSKLSFAAGLCRYHNGSVTLLAGSRLIYWFLGMETEYKNDGKQIMSLRREDQVCVRNALQTMIRTREMTECSFWYYQDDENKKWVKLQLYFLEENTESKYFMYMLSDMTQQRELEQELRRYKSAIFKPDNYSNKILIVDDQEMNRVILKEIFRNHYEVLEASNGKEAIEMLKQNCNDVDVILLDLMMPVMSGSEFLEYKNSHPEIEDIPVVVITADGSMNQQVNTLALGADDYIVKPFVVEVVLRRIRNVLESHRRFREVLREYNHIVAQAKADSLTKLYNRAAAQEHINRILNMEADQMHALIMLDVDKFKIFNDTYGHKFGDDMLMKIAAKIKDFFRDTDIVSRFGGDEFCVFMRSVSSENMALNKCIELCREINNMHMQGCDRELSVSVGIAVTSKEFCTFDTLYRNADNALYTSKRNGRNQATLYGTMEYLKEEQKCGQP